MLSFISRSEPHGARLLALVLFDLDETLLSADSDVLWGEYLCREGLVDKAAYSSQNDAFYQQYKAGQLDVQAYLAFVAAPLAELPRDELEAHRTRYLERDIKPIILQEGLNLIDRHRFSDELPVLVTATIDFVSAPIAALLGIADVIAPIAGRTPDGGYTGTTVGVPSFGPGKLTRVNAWLAARSAKPQSLADSWFYSDSINDLTLLEAVAHPVAVDPDEPLQAIAVDRGWKVISLRPQRGLT